MKKYCFIIFISILSVYLIGCDNSDLSSKKPSDLKTISSEQTILTDVKNQNDYDISSIDKYSFENYMFIGDPGTNFYIDKNNCLWSWTSQSYDFFNKTILDTETKPVKVLENVVHIMDEPKQFHIFQRFPYFIKEDGSFWGKISNSDENNPFIKLLDNIKYANSSDNEHVAVTENGDLFVWGYQPSFDEDNKIEEPIKTLENIAFIDTSSHVNFAIEEDGTLWSWGDSHVGELGNGQDYVYGAPPSKILDNVKSIVQSYDRLDPTIYALKNDGSLWAWGNNKYGAVGVGTTDNTTIPIKILDNVTSITASNLGDGSFETYSFAYALKNDGTLWAWGYNQKGSVGNGTTENVLSPVQILDNVAEIQCDNLICKNISFAIKNDGSLWGWGLNTTNQLGNGTLNNVLTPIKISDNVKNFIPNNFNTYILTENNILLGCGLNLSYQLKRPQEESTLQQIKLLENVQTIKNVGDITYAITEDKSLWICGYNEAAIFDSNSESKTVSPEYSVHKILDNVKWIDGTQYNNYVMTYDGELYHFLTTMSGDAKLTFTEPTIVPLPK